MQIRPSRCALIFLSDLFFPALFPFLLFFFLSFFMQLHNRALCTTSSCSRSVWNTVPVISSERETEGGSSTSRPHQVTEGAQLTGASRPGIQVHCTTDWPGEDRERRPDLAFCTPGRQSLDSVSRPWLSSVLALKPLS